MYSAEMPPRKLAGSMIECMKYNLKKPITCDDRWVGGGLSVGGAIVNMSGRFEPPTDSL